MALENYVKYVHTSACFDKILDIKKAISANDPLSALVHLGELKEQLWVLHSYIECLEGPSATREVLQLAIVKK